MTTKKGARFRGTKIATVVTAVGAFAVLLGGIATAGDAPDTGDEAAVAQTQVLILREPLLLPSGEQVPAGSQVVAQAPAKSPPKVTTSSRKSRGS